MTERVEIMTNFGQAKGSTLYGIQQQPITGGHRHTFVFSNFGPEPMAWQFRIIPKAQTFSIDITIKSTRVPGMLPNR